MVEKQTGNYRVRTLSQFPRRFDRQFPRGVKSGRRRFRGNMEEGCSRGVGGWQRECGKEYREQRFYWRMELPTIYPELRLDTTRFAEFIPSSRLSKGTRSRSNVSEHAAILLPRMETRCFFIPRASTISLPPFFLSFFLLRSQSTGHRSNAPFLSSAK